jgi:Uma2 family endonuclease
MRAVMSQVPEHFLERRKRIGADRWDEMWEGELHMPPAPNLEHQDLEWAIESWLRNHWAPRRGSKVYHQINVASRGGWPNDYRLPDLVLLTPDRFQINKMEYFDGGPTAVVEIRSPGDESMDKLPFYGRIGVEEAWIIDRDTKVPEIYLLRGEDREPATPDADGWLLSPATGVQLRGGSPAKLVLQLASRPETRQLLP